MTRLPVVPAAKVIKALEKAGFDQVRTRGSHVMLRNADNGRGVTVPLHDPVKRGTLGAILRQAGVDVDEFVDLLS